MFLLGLRQLPRCEGLRPLLQFPQPPRVGPVLPILLFFPLVPLAYQVLRGSRYTFPLVRSSCPLSAGVLHALLCLKMCSWCIRRERCTPHPPTPPPSCSPQSHFLNKGRYSINAVSFCIYVWKSKITHHSYTDGTITSFAAKIKCHDSVEELIQFLGSRLL